MSTPSSEDAAVELTRQQGHLSSSQIEQVFDKLQPVTLQFMLGEWRGGVFDTGHQLNAWLQGLQWGKTFRSFDDVEPVVIYNEAGERVWDEEYGKARLREVKIRGVVSAAMVYDSRAIIDGFRRVTDDLVLGVMDTKLPEYAPEYYFYLERL